MKRSRFLTVLVVFLILVVVLIVVLVCHSCAARSTPDGVDMPSDTTTATSSVSGDNSSDSNGSVSSSSGSTTVSTTSSTTVSTSAGTTSSSSSSSSSRSGTSSSRSSISSTSSSSSSSEATGAGTSPPSSSAADDIRSLADQVIGLINAERVAAGLPELSTSSALNSAAQARADEIARHFAHERPDGTSYATILDEYSISRSAWGENIARGHRTAQTVMDGWMASQGHRDNILRSSFSQVGVGVAQGDDGQAYWVQLFIG